MRTKRGADALFPSTRKKVLAALFMQPGRDWFMSDLARHIRVPKTSLQRELGNLERAEIVRRREEGKHVYFRANPDCPFLPEIRGLMAKTAGLADIVGESLRPVRSRIAFAFIYGSLARGEEGPTSDVDLLVVGKVGLHELAIPLRKAQDRISREINPTVYTPEEFGARFRDGKGIVRALVDDSKVFVIGGTDDLERATGTETRRARTGR